MPHQRFRNGGVHSVHAHVVAVIGCPAQRQLAQVTGADDQSTPLVGKVHQHLCALPRLSVFKGDGVIVHALADVTEVHLHGLADVHPHQLGTQLLCQNTGVVPGAVGGTEAGHGDGENSLVLPAQQVKGDGGDEDSKGGVQTAAESYNGGFCVGVLQSLGKSLRRKPQNLGAALLPVAPVGGNKGVGVDVAGEGGFYLFQLETGVIDLGGSGEGVHPPSLVG